MRVLIIHNKYRSYGGEDAAVRGEIAMLESAGHTVIRYFRSSGDVSLDTLTKKASFATNLMWSGETYRAIQALICRERPHVAHCHNLFPLISTSAYSACRNEGVPIVQTLHNFRLFCPGSTLFRDGHVCEQCVTMGSVVPSIIHRCYQGSCAATTLMASMLEFHRHFGTWKRSVDVYVALSEFARRKFQEAGLNGSHIEVKSNPSSLEWSPRSATDSAVFVGRLSGEKGVATLLKAWKAADVALQLRIIGDGPLRAELERECATLQLNRVRFEGHLEHGLAIEAIRSSRFVVFPSQCYENCPMTIIEAFACGVPVFAAHLGAAAEMIEDWRTGRLFTPGNLDQLAQILKWAFANRDATEAMGQRSRVEFELKYDSAQNLRLLERIYERAIARRQAFLN